MRVVGQGGCGWRVLLGRGSVEGRQVRVKEGDCGVNVSGGGEEGEGRRDYEVRSAGTNDVEQKVRSDAYGQRRQRLL